MYEERYEENNYRPSGNRNPMALAAVVFGVLSLFLSTVFYLSLPLGALAVLFAVLSRTGPRMTGKSKAGMICGICGMIATVVLTVSSLHYVLTDPAGRSYLEYYYRMYTGDHDFDIDKELPEIFPFLGKPSEPTPELVPDGSGLPVPKSAPKDHVPGAPEDHGSDAPEHNSPDAPESVPEDKPEKDGESIPDDLQIANGEGVFL